MGRAVPTIKVLREARKLVADEKTWCRGTLARDAHGTPCAMLDAAAKCYCASGAIGFACMRCGVDAHIDRDPLFIALSKLSRSMFGEQFLHRVNDNYGRLAALSVIDAAIAELGETP